MLYRVSSVPNSFLGEQLDTFNCEAIQPRAIYLRARAVQKNFSLLYCVIYLLQNRCFLPQKDISLRRGHDVVKLFLFYKLFLLGRYLQIAAGNILCPFQGLPGNKVSGR